MNTSRRTQRNVAEVLRGIDKMTLTEPTLDGGLTSSCSEGGTRYGKQAGRFLRIERTCVREYLICRRGQSNTVAAQGLQHR